MSNRCSYYTGLDCEESLFFFRFSEGSTRARERLAAKTRATRARAWSFACLARFARLYGIAFLVGTKRYPVYSLRASPPFGGFRETWTRERRRESGGGPSPK